MVKYIIKYGTHTFERNSLLDAREIAYASMLRYNYGYTNAYIYVNKVTDPKTKPGFKYVLDSNETFPREAVANGRGIVFKVVDERNFLRVIGKVNPDGTLNRHGRNA